MNEKSKLNIDNTTNSVYAQYANGGAIDATKNQLYRNADAGVWLGRDGFRLDTRVQSRPQDDGRGDIQLSRIVLLNQQAKDKLTQSGVDFTEVRDASADATAFSNALNNARLAGSRNGTAGGD